MEKPTKYFCSLEKYYYIEKTIKCIQLDNGETLTDQKSILDEIAKFYSTRFAQKDHSPSGYGGRVVTLSPPTSEAGVRSPARPQVGKLVVACCWSAVYSTEP